MSKAPQKTIQRVVGWLCALAFVGLAYLSMSPDLNLTWPVIVGMITLIAMLLGKMDALEGVVHAWKNGRG